MIIECPCKKKKFNIDINLIPAEGRNLQCGSCDRVWFYKKEELIFESPQVNEYIAIKEKEDSDKLNDDKSKNQLIKQPVEENEKAKSKLSNINKTEENPSFLLAETDNEGLTASVISSVNSMDQGNIGMSTNESKL